MEPSQPVELTYFQDIAKADITVRCSDQGQFYVYKIILATASPVFQDMLVVSGGSHTTLISMDNNVHPAVQVTEDSKTMEILLQFCYPLDDPVIEALPDLHRVLVACDKYQMDALGRRISRLLDGFASVDPLRVFCIACHTRSMAAAKTAAFECLRRPYSQIIRTDIPEIHLIGAPTLLQLLRYYDACVKAAVKTVLVGFSSDMHWITNELSCWFQCRECAAATDGEIRIKNGSMGVQPRSWWARFMSAAANKLADSPGSFSVATRVTVHSPNCPVCGPAHVNDMLRFVPEMEEAIRSAIRKVPLDLTF